MQAAFFFLGRGAERRGSPPSSSCRGQKLWAVSHPFRKTQSVKILPYARLLLVKGFIHAVFLSYKPLYVRCLWRGTSLDNDFSVEIFP